MREGLGATMVLLVHQDLVLPGCVLDGGIGKNKWVSKYCALCRFGHNLIVGMLRFVYSENGEGLMMVRLESRFR